MGLFVIAVVLLLSMLFDAPLAEQANPGLSPNPTKAPWYFMGLQEILLHFHPVFAVLVIPSALTLGLLCIPFLRQDVDAAGIWFASRRGRRLALVAAVLGSALTSLAVIADEFGFRTGSAEPAGLVSNGLLPSAVMAGIVAVFYLSVRRLLGANRTEAVQALFTLLLGSFVTLTLIGIWFRGPGMQLMWSG